MWLIKHTSIQAQCVRIKLNPTRPTMFFQLCAFLQALSLPPASHHCLVSDSEIRQLPPSPFNHQLTNMPESQCGISDSSCLLTVHYESLHPQLHCYTYSMVVLLCACKDISATLGENSGMSELCYCVAPTVISDISVQPDVNGLVFRLYCY